MKAFQIKIAVLLVAGAAGACSLLNQKSDPQAKVRAFLGEFQKSLKGSDDDILKFFNTDQNKSIIFAAVRLWQNNPNRSVKCDVPFDSAAIAMDPTGIRVTIHGRITIDTLDFTITDTASFVMNIAPVKGKLFITQLEATNFYDRSVSLRYTLNNAAVEKMQADKIDMYAKAVEELKKTYDTVIWAVEYGKKYYFYVAKGPVSPPGQDSNNMGLVDQTGQVIIPVEYDLIGTPGFVKEDYVEVRKGGLVGYYTMQGDTILGTDYQWIIFQNSGAVLALAKKDEEVGWINQSHEFKAGFPSAAAKKYINEFEYLDGLVISSKKQAACEVPTSDGIGSGYIIPPAYLVSTGLFEMLISDIVIDESVMRANTQSVEVSRTFSESVIGTFNVMVADITSNYLEGRQGFYTQKNLEFIDQNGQAWGVTNTGIYGDVTFNKIDSTLLEVKSVSAAKADDYMGGAEDGREFDLPTYTYFSLGESHPEKKESNRQYPFTEFVKLSDDYLSGNFTFFNPTTSSYDTRNYLCDATLTEMRNEILASYGYIFPDETTEEHFKYFKWYQPAYESLDQVKGNMTELDKYNVEYLEKVIGTHDKPNS